jgi:hypothetical protein
MAVLQQFGREARFAQVAIGLTSRERRRFGNATGRSTSGLRPVRRVPRSTLQLRQSAAASFQRYVAARVGATLAPPSCGR